MQHLLSLSLQVYSKIRNEIDDLLGDTRPIDAEYRGFTTRHLRYYSERCQSLNLLLQEWRLWDSDIVMRSALECATRFIFVSIAAPNERAQRIYEYTEALSEIGDIQRSEKAKAFVEAGTDADSAMLVGGIVLSPERESELRDRWPKSKRNAIKQKWSFSEMVREITSFHAELLDLRKYNSFLHGYGLSSHLIHADQAAMDLIRDRALRNPDEREALQRAHFARLAADQTSILFLCWRAMIYATGIDSKNTEIFEDVIRVTEEAQVFHRIFAQSQENFYRKDSG